MRTLNDADRAALLAAAARLIESRQPSKVATLRYRFTLSPNGPSLFLVRFDFPGVVSVYAHDTGDLLVRSKAGQPTEPDTLLGVHAP
jgi:hypothetical protein